MISSSSSVATIGVIRTTRQLGALANASTIKARAFIAWWTTLSVGASKCALPLVTSFQAVGELVVAGFSFARELRQAFHCQYKSSQNTVTIGLAFSWTEESSTTVRVFMNSNGISVQENGIDLAPGARNEHLLFLSRRV